jgi:hypothetical protein
MGPSSAGSHRGRHQINIITRPRHKHFDVNRPITDGSYRWAGERFVFHNDLRSRLPSTCISVRHRTESPERNVFAAGTGRLSFAPMTNDAEAKNALLTFLFLLSTHETHVIGPSPTDEVGIVSACFVRLPTAGRTSRMSESRPEWRCGGNLTLAMRQGCRRDETLAAS